MDDNPFRWYRYFFINRFSKILKTSHEGNHSIKCGIKSSMVLSNGGLVLLLLQNHITPRMYLTSEINRVSLTSQEVLYCVHTNWQICKLHYVLQFINTSDNEVFYWNQH